MVSQWKQEQRAIRIANLPSAYFEPVSIEDRNILNQSVEQLAQNVRFGSIRPIDILRSYGKVAIMAHRQTNCLTEVMLPEAEVWAEEQVRAKGRRDISVTWLGWIFG